MMAMLAFPEAGLVQDDGVFVADDFRNCSPPEQAFDWTPAYDMDWPGAPNPITAPALPIPFTAGELAAFMLDGMGAGLQEYLGRRIGCPLDDEALKRFGKRGRLVREALRSAYALAEQAQSVVGKFDYKKQKRAYDKRSELESANEQAIRSEGVFEAGISGEEASQRRARAVSSTAKLRARVLKACAKSDATWIAWRAAMVRQLLQPEPLAMMAPSATPTATERADAVPANLPNWVLIRPERFPGYRKPLYDFLKAANIAGQERPTAYDVLDKWRRNPPTGILEVIDNELKFENSKGEPDTATLAAVKKSIDRLAPNSHPTSGR